MRRRITRSYAGMKSILLVLLFVLVGCGGHSPLLTPATSNETITADQVFRNTTQTWEFVSHCRNLLPDGSRGPYVEAHTKIEVVPMLLQTVWHYTKDQPCAYWNPDTPQAELWFVMRQTDGLWSSTAALINFPQSCAFCTNPPNWKTLTSDISQIAGQPMPYGIIPASATRTAAIIDTAYQSHTQFNMPEPDFSDITQIEPANAPVAWRNNFYVEDVTTPIYTGPAMVSEQWEGPCFPTMQPGCAHEKWYFAPGLGLVKVIPINIGAGDNADPNLSMVRIT